MKYNGKDIKTLNLSTDKEIILTGSINKLIQFALNPTSVTHDAINIYGEMDSWKTENVNIKSLLKYMAGWDISRKCISIKLLVKDELKILSLIETLNLTLLEVIYMVYIEDKKVEWLDYN